MKELLSSSKVVVAVGPGGVGKTTVAAAAAAIMAAKCEAKVLVLTVDPAKRLAGALGVGPLGNQASKVAKTKFEEIGIRPKGELWAAMLDTKAAWDDLVRRHAPDPRTAAEIFDNALYENISGRFIQSHDYIAAERLYELHSGGEFDLIIVDTPPSRHAIDFLDAPARMAEFFSSRLLRWLLAPYRSRLVNLASKPFTQVADKILGGVFLSDIAQFFQLFQSMYSGFVERSKAVSALLGAPGSSFLVVSTLDPGPRREAENLIESISNRGFHLGGILLNKSLPNYLLRGDVARAAESIAAFKQCDLDLLASATGVDPNLLEAVLREVTQSFVAYSALAGIEEEQRREVSGRGTVLTVLPHLQDDIHDLAGVMRAGEIMWDSSDPDGDPNGDVGGNADGDERK